MVAGHHGGIAERTGENSCELRVSIRDAGFAFVESRYDVPESVQRFVDLGTLLHAIRAALVPSSLVVLGAGEITAGGRLARSQSEESGDEHQAEDRKSVV